MTHSEMSKKNYPISGRYCTAHDMTFGGKCLNCGFGFDKQPAVYHPHADPREDKNHD